MVCLQQALADKGEASDKSEYEGDEKNMDRDKVLACAREGAGMAGI